MPDINRILREPQWKGYSERGADMGRGNILEAEAPCRLHLQRVRLGDGGCYDAGGAYWGAPNDLWCAFAHNEDGDMIVMIFVRGRNREAAKQAVDEILPEEGYTYYR